MKPIVIAIVSIPDNSFYNIFAAYLFQILIRLNSKLSEDINYMNLRDDNFSCNQSESISENYKTPQTLNFDTSIMPMAYTSLDNLNEYLIQNPDSSSDYFSVIPCPVLSRRRRFHPFALDVLDRTQKYPNSLNDIRKYTYQGVEIVNFESRSPLKNQSQGSPSDLRNTNDALNYCELSQNLSVSRKNFANKLASLIYYWCVTEYKLRTQQQKITTNLASKTGEPSSSQSFWIRNCNTSPACNRQIYHWGFRRS